ITPGDLFFALKGESFNGNLYAMDALARGALLAVCDDAEGLPDHPGIFMVDDSLAALQELASLYRSDLQIPFIGITGSNGKTTTKELVSAVLSDRYKVSATQGNLNNHIGVPLTILRIPADAEIAVVEMGANHPGEIRELCRIARPDSGIITNIGKAHLEGFGGFGGVVQAKSELYASLRQNIGTAFVNAGDPLLMRLSEGLDRVLYGPGTGIDARIAAEDITLSMEFSGYALHEGRLSTQLYGSYNLPNILGAMAIGLHYEISWDGITKAIAGYVPKNNRSEVRQTGRNTLVLDAYNANPSSMEASLRNFAGLPGGPKWIILGDMLELGEEGPDEHRRMLELAVSLNFRQIILVGPIFSQLAGSDIKAFHDTTECYGWLRENAPGQVLILMKGSRGIHLEDLIGLL
ncbi:MAG: UDP-N-acetylmuramoyl-tripeptide--D-alanyl-D-alanine ligase, partial [Bacteroidales bacterium]|nr:UDP-N-acetylmuramoyl-tripeptide--D-alanyl-D-alanine ligase [Bacteroidales bacterium]